MILTIRISYFTIVFDNMLYIFIKCIEYSQVTSEFGLKSHYDNHYNLF